MNKNILSVFSAAVVTVVALTSCTPGDLIKQGSSLPTFSQLNWDQVEEVHADAVLTGVNIKLRKPEKPVEGLVPVYIDLRSTQIDAWVVENKIPSVIVGGVTGEELKRLGDIKISMCIDSSSRYGSPECFTGLGGSLSLKNLPEGFERGVRVQFSYTLPSRQGGETQLPIRPTLQLDKSWSVGYKGVDSVGFKYIQPTPQPTPTLNPTAPRVVLSD